jgi:polyisoprenoid-binding protein YceI/hemerythrin-like domain-containing protein
MTMPTIADQRSNLEESIQTILGGDHQRLEKSFEAVVAASTCDDLEALHELWRGFQRELLAHLDAEETHILPLFAKSDPDEAEELLDQHARLRERLLELAIDLDLHSLTPEQVRIFIGELRSHSAREDQLLYPWAERQLGRIAGAHLHRALAAAKAPPLPDPGWRIDSARSTLRFSLRHIVIQEIRGEFTRWGGTLSIDEVDPTRSRARVWVGLASVDTGNAERDAQVRSPEFFDVGRFPRATFASTEIRLPDGGNPVIRGRLRLHGAEGEVDLEIVQRDERKDADGNARAIYRLKGRFDRRDFGLRWNQDLDVGGVVVGDQVQIEAHVEATRRAPPQGAPRR